MRRFAFGLLGLALATAGCGDLPQPFRHEGPNGLLDPGDIAPILVKPVEGGPDGLAEAVADALGDMEIAASAKPVRGPAMLLEGRAWTQNGRPMLKWQLYGQDGAARGDKLQPVAASSWDRAPLRTVGRAGAETVAALLREKGEATEARTARIRLAPVTGAPGDGNSALLKAMKSALRSAGLDVTDENPTYIVRGTVSVARGRPGEDNVDIAWIVTAADGKALGTAAQSSPVAAGTLDGPWGLMARDIAGGGAEGVAEIVTAAEEEKRRDAPTPAGRR